MSQPPLAHSTPLVEVLPDSLAKKIVGELDLTTVESLLTVVPRTYRERGNTDPATGISDGDPIGFSGHVRRINDNFSGGRHPKVAAVFVEVSTSDGPRTAVFFNMKFVRRIISVGDRIDVLGIAKIRNNQVTCINPTFRLGERANPSPGTHHDPDTGRNTPRRTAKDVLDLADEVIVSRGELPLLERPMLPVYRASGKVTSWDVLAAMAIVAGRAAPFPETLPVEILAQHGLMRREQAWRAVHFPANQIEVDGARRRLKFDVALATHIRLGQRRLRLEAGVAPPSAPRDDGLRAALEAHLPFTLTVGQRAVVDEISADLARAHPTARLLQGDVGSGKTVVSLMAMCQVVDAGRQCAMLAPTEVLAAQHERSLRGLLGELAAPAEAATGTLMAASDGQRRIRIVRLSGSMSSAQRREALLAVVSGEADIIVGTHALLDNAVAFFDLGLAVIDEQHRFGVEQREVLRQKRADHAMPHMLSMTATPIPRSVAMMTFGDMHTSYLTQRPAGRQDVATFVVNVGVPGRDVNKWVNRVFDRVHEEIAAHGRAFVVAPRIDSSPPSEADLAAAAEAARRGETSVVDHPVVRPGIGVEELYRRLREVELADLRLSMVHGRLPGAVKDQALNDLAAGAIDVLVATTVIEVGVDVPDATIMVIINAERFGMSQLHQLRGRVGRGERPGVCLLVTAAREGSEGDRRVTAAAATDDGFKLAQMDLELRGEGDVFGLRQSGSGGHRRILSVAADHDIISEAGELAAQLLHADPELEYLPQLAAEADDWGAADYLDRT